MIDTDKYEGHVLVDGKWVKNAMSQKEYDATKALIKDAPLLLAEIKRFHEMKKWLLENHTQVMLQYTYGRVD